MSETTLPAGFVPTQDWVLVQLPEKEKENKTDFGLILAEDTPMEGPQEAVVVSVGPGYFDQNGARVPMDIQVGDTVVYNQFSGTPYKYGKTEYYFMNARGGSILAIIRGDNNV
jgi:chaperonin GroES